MNTCPKAAVAVSMLVPSRIHAKYQLRQNAECPCNPQLCRVFNPKITHSIPRRPLFIISLQDDSACAHAEYGDIAVEQLLETERFVEGFAGIKVLCRNKGACRFRTAWNHPSGRPSC